MLRHSKIFTKIPIEAKCKTKNRNVVTPPASLGVRGEQPANHSKILGLDEPDFLVPYMYGHIHAPLCGAGVPYTSRKRPPGQLIWLAARGPVHNIPSVLVQRRRSMHCMCNPECGTFWDWRQAGRLSDDAHAREQI